MKIGVVTNLDKQNYGSVLQAYALQKKLGELNSESFVIEKRSVHKKSLFDKIKALVLPSKNGYSLKVRWDIKKARKELVEKNRKISEFCNANVKSQICSDMSEVSQVTKDCQLVIAGSDQIWSSTAGLLSDFTLLNFSENDSFAKASFSASVGVSELSDTDKEIFKEKLKNFDTVSMREKTATRLISECTSVETRTDIDPSFLYDGNYWSSIKSDFAKGEKYIFVYVLRAEPIALESAKRLSEKTGLKIKICSNRIIKGKNIENITNAGIEDFLALISNAEYVVTNSFHGTAFSVQFNKKFLSVAVAGTGSRVLDFLDDAKLSERVISSPDQIEKINNDINWNLVNSIISEKRNNSTEYLKYLVNKYK